MDQLFKAALSLCIRVDSGPGVRVRVRVRGRVLWPPPSPALRSLKKLVHELSMFNYFLSMISLLNKIF